MQNILISDNYDILRLIGGSNLENPGVFATDNEELMHHARKNGLRPVLGDIGDASFIRSLKISPRDSILVSVNKRSLKKVLTALLSTDHDLLATVILEESQKLPVALEERVRLITPRQLVGTPERELSKVGTKRAVARLRAIFGGHDKMLILLQDDPDPDGIASAMALRALLGRNKLSGVIASFGEVTRPENMAMVRLLNIELQKITEEELKHFGKIALVDVQPHHSPRIPTAIDAVVDHHPRRDGYTTGFADIRPHYGATSTIFTEYLLAERVPISQRLATALTYGIKTDTQLLGRATTARDVDAFAALYPHANHALLRRIDRPQLPRMDIPSVGIALKNLEIIGNCAFAHLGPFTREDVVPYFADLCLEIEDVEWSVVSGIFEGNLVISVRSFGNEGSSGTVAKAAFDEFGSAGGHKIMAKAVIPLMNLPPDCLDHAQWLRNRFLKALPPF